MTFRVRATRRGLVALVAAAVLMVAVPGVAFADTGSLTFEYLRVNADGSTSSPGGTLTVAQGADVHVYPVTGAPFTVDVPTGLTTITMTPTPDPSLVAGPDTYLGDESTYLTYDQTAQVTIYAQAPALSRRDFRVENPFVGDSNTSGVSGANVTIRAVPEHPATAGWNISDQGGVATGAPATVAAQPAVDLTTDPEGWVHVYLNPIAAYEWDRASASVTIGGVAWTGQGPPGFTPPGPGAPSYIPVAPGGPAVPDSAQRLVAGRVGPMLGAGINYTVSVNGASVPVDDRGWFRTTVAGPTAQITMEDGYLAAQLPMPVTFTATTSHDTFLDIGYPDNTTVDLTPDMAGQPYTDLALAPIHQCTTLRVLGADSYSTGCSDLQLAPEPGVPTAVRVRYIGETFDSNPALTLTATATGPADGTPYPVTGTLSSGNALLGGYNDVPLYGVASPAPPDYVVAQVTATGVTVGWVPPASSLSPITAYQVRTTSATVSVASTAKQITLPAGTDPKTTVVRAVSGYGPSRWKSPGAVDSTPPRISLAALPLVTLATTLNVSWSATDAVSGVATFDVRYTRASASAPFSAWTYPSSWQHRSTARVSLSLAAGYGYCIQVRARDHAGNTSAWSSSRCMTRALDDRSLTTSTGWARRTGSAFYMGTYTSTTKYFASLYRLGLRFRRVAVVATTCPSCGTIGVYSGKTLLGKINLRSTSTMRHRILLLPVSSLRIGEVRLRVLTRGRLVQIDGLAVTQT